MSKDINKKSSDATRAPDIELQPFKPKGAGAKWSLSNGCFVEAHPGENGEVYICWHNGERTTIARLSNEAAKTTAVALLRYVGAESDLHTHPSA